MSSIKYSYRGKFNPHCLEPTNIDRLSTSLVPPNSRLLELGCSTGFMSQYFTSQKNCQVTGVELNPAAAKKARLHCHRVITADLNQPATFTKLQRLQPFDVIFASAIIEHLLHPQQFLHHLYQLLTPDGLLIITFPNVAHWRQRLHLLTGNWDYQAYGILDSTHLKFFTYFTAQTLILSSGFAIQSIHVDPAGGIKFLDPLFKPFPNLYAHQFVIHAQKSP